MAITNHGGGGRAGNQSVFLGRKGMTGFGIDHYGVDQTLGLFLDQLNLTTFRCKMAITPFGKRDDHRAKITPTLG